MQRFLHSPAMSEGAAGLTPRIDLCALPEVEEGHESRRGADPDGERVAELQGGDLLHPGGGLVPPSHVGAVQRAHSLLTSVVPGLHSAVRGADAGQVGF